MTSKMDIEFIGNVSIYLGIGIEIIIALLLGGLIGFDREKKMKSAGIRTNILICLGATLYTALSLINQKNFGGIADPNRTAAQIVTGVGFLGAGAIIQGRGNVVIGLTTAATIWTCAAVGVTIGMGYPFVATIFTLTVLVVLKLLSPIYRMFELEKDNKHYQMEILSRGPVKRSIKEVIRDHSAILEELHTEITDKESDERIVNLILLSHPRKIQLLTKDIKRILRVEKLNFRITEFHADEED